MMKGARITTPTLKIVGVLMENAKIHKVSPKLRRAFQEGDTRRLNDQQREDPHQGRTGGHGTALEVYLAVAFGELNPKGNPVGLRRNHLS